MTFGSLFDGIYGFGLGIESAGMTCAWTVEIDPDCRRVTAARRPSIQQFEDVRKCGKRNLSPVDVLTGGFPCQDLSVVGKRGGLSAKRSGLFFEMMRIIREIRPGIVVIENVPGLRSSPPQDPGRDFQTVLRCVAALRVYECAWTGLDAQWFGLAQRRQRVFIVLAHRNLGAGCAAEILALSARRQGDFAARGEAGSRIAAALRSRSHAPGVSGPGRGGEDDENLVAGTITGGAHPGGFNGRDAETENIIASTLFASEGGASSGMHPIIASGRHQNVADRMIVRRLTPTECLRLQGFPDDWLDIEPPLSDSAKYRMIGNAVAVPVVAWIAKRIMEAHP